MIFHLAKLSLVLHSYVPSFKSSLLCTANSTKYNIVNCQANQVKSIISPINLARLLSIRIRTIKCILTNMLPGTVFLLIWQIIIIDLWHFSHLISLQNFSKT